MKNALLILALFSTGAWAQCIGSSAIQTCTDASGNTYNIQRYGNTTAVQGSAANGSTWSQNSTTFGNTTMHNGTAANGQPWSGTTSTFGNTTIHQGVDSRGRPYSSTCINGICN